LLKKLTFNVFNFKDKMKHLSSCSYITSIGGGTGLGKVLSSLSFLEDRLTGIVATTDDGGSTGRLRLSNGCIAWGDIRNCINQICEDSPDLARMIFEYRIKSKGELDGHSLGNIILMAVEQMCVRPLDAVQLIRDMLNIKIKIIPMSEEPAKLGAIIAGNKIIGETFIDSLTQLPESLLITPTIKPTKEAIIAINKSDIIILGPGSFMSSIMPPLLLPEIANAIINSQAKKIFIGNVKKEQSAVVNLSLSGQLKWMHDMSGVYPDIILWPSEREQPSRIDCQIKTYRLADNNNSSMHDKQAIVSALDDIIA
jgi:uncharacterized cofD-like protein